MCTCVFILNDLESGNWLNKSSNLDSKNQDYQLAGSDCEEVCIGLSFGHYVGGV